MEILNRAAFLLSIIARLGARLEAKADELSDEKSGDGQLALLHLWTSVGPGQGCDGWVVLEGTTARYGLWLNGERNPQFTINCSPEGEFGGSYDLDEGDASYLESIDPSIQFAVSCRHWNLLQCPLESPRIELTLSDLLERTKDWYA